MEQALLSVGGYPFGVISSWTWKSQEEVTFLRLGLYCVNSEHVRTNVLAWHIG